MMNLIPFHKGHEIFSVPTNAWVDRFLEDFSPLFRSEGGEWHPFFD